jgi:hypothetical protein
LSWGEQRGIWFVAGVDRDEEASFLNGRIPDPQRRRLGWRITRGEEAVNRSILPPAMHRLLLTKKLPLSLAELATESTAQERRAGNF